MSKARIDIVLIAGALLAWIAVFTASAQGLLHVSGIVSDGILVFLAIIIAHRLWRIWGRKDG